MGRFWNRERGELIADSKPHDMRFFEAAVGVDRAGAVTQPSEHAVLQRAGFRDFVGAGFIDTFRHFEKGAGHYSWWTYRANARANNVGWRIDYVMASTALKPRLKRAWIEADVHGSDHCPVGVELKP